MQGFDLDAVVGFFNFLKNLPPKVFWLLLAVLISAILTLVSFLFDFFRQKIKNNSKKSEQIKISNTSNEINAIIDLLIGKKSKFSHKTILFAGSSIYTLPVTKIVGAGVEIAKSGEKVLLVDLDLKRDPIQKVFGGNDLSDKDVAAVKKPDAEETSITAKKFTSINCKNISATGPQKTFVKGLDIWPSSIFRVSKCMNLSQILKENNKKYTKILIYCPYLEASPDRNQISKVSQASFIFCKNEEQETRLLKLFNNSKCKILACFRIEEKSQTAVSA